MLKIFIRKTGTFIMTLANIGLDDGARSIKLFGSNDIRYMCDSYAKSGHPTEIVLNDQPKSQFLYHTDETEFVVGDISEPSPTTNDSYQYSKGNRVLVHHALHKAGFTGKKVAVCVGVPYSLYYLPDGTVNKKVIQRKKRNLINKNVASEFGQVSIKKVDVIAECLAGWFHLALKVNGTGGVDIVTEVFHSSIGMVDVGGNSIDICSVSGGRIDNELSDTKKRSGMLMVYREVRKLLTSKFGYDIDESDVRKAINKPKNDNYFMLLMGQEVNINDVVHQAMKTVANRIMDMVRDTLHDPNKFKAIYIFGGGAMALRKYLEELMEDYPMIRFPKDPQFMNARGMYKYLLMNQAKKHAAA